MRINIHLVKIRRVASTRPYLSTGRSQSAAHLIPFRHPAHARSWHRSTPSIDAPVFFTDHHLAVFARNGPAGGS